MEKVDARRGRDARVDSPVYLRVEGLVARPQQLSPEDVATLPRTSCRGVLQCEHRGEAGDQVWGGISLHAIMALAEPQPEARYVRVHAQGYCVPLALDEVDEALLVDTLDGQPLSKERGAPWRLFIPGSHCHVNVKWVDRLELTAARGTTSEGSSGTGAGAWAHTRQGVSAMTSAQDVGQAAMRDSATLPTTARTVTARSEVLMQPATLRAIVQGQIPKGDVLATARIAGIMAAKRTAELIPLCHPVLLSSVAVELTPNEAASSIVITATVRSVGQTGVVMEAMTAASVAALTIFDMTKGRDRGMTIANVQLVEKHGGHTGDWQR